MVSLSDTFFVRMKIVEFISRRLGDGEGRGEGGYLELKIRYDTKKHWLGHKVKSLMRGRAKKLRLTNPRYRPSRFQVPYLLNKITLTG